MKENKYLTPMLFEHIDTLRSEANISNTRSGPAGRRMKALLDMGLVAGLTEEDKNLPALSDIETFLTNLEAGMEPGEAMRRFEHIRIKGDPLYGFTGSLPMHLSRD